ncbi:methyltransferase domain-containing protein [Nocardia sp. XZ_19_385]|uniref:methyltransferase domain-containing protein n=1 Tax=Nocardia sp. XZ_19_385 TaxID=2769488 RepID=UPI00189013BE|nr:methyltransferase domain-containing protein [Nocardia sp. XZ_19_385]
MNESTTHSANPADEVGILLTNPRSYLIFRSVFMLGRSTSLNRKLAVLSGVRPGNRVADIGCGPGDLVRHLAQRTGAEGSVTGVDPSPEMIAYSTTHSAHLPNCTFELAPAQQLPLPDASLDVLTCTFVMHHIPEAHRPAAVAQMFRVLRPGGRILLADTHPRGLVLPALIRAMGRSAGRKTHDHAAIGPDADPVAAVDIRRYRDLLRQTGFRDIEFTAVRPITGALLAVKPD